METRTPLERPARGVRTIRRYPTGGFYPTNDPVYDPRYDPNCPGDDSLAIVAFVLLAAIGLGIGALLGSTGTGVAIVGGVGFMFAGARQTFVWRRRQAAGTESLWRSTAGAVIEQRHDRPAVGFVGSRRSAL